MDRYAPSDPSAALRTAARRHPGSGPGKASGSHGPSRSLPASRMLLDSGRSWAIRGHDLQPWQREESRSVRTARVGLLLSEERLRFLHLSAARTRRLAWRLHHGPAEASLYVSPDGPKCRTQSSSCPAGAVQQRRGSRGALAQGAEMGRLATYRDDGNFFWRYSDPADRRKRSWNS